MSKEEVLYRTLSDRIEPIRCLKTHASEIVRTLGEQQHGISKAILFKMIHGKVYGVLIADGRRDMQTLLPRRLLEG